MALSELQRAEVARLLDPLCRPHPDAAVSAQMRRGYRVQGHQVVLFTARASWSAPDQWMEEAVAKFTYVATRRQWHLYCQHSDLRWHAYELLPTAPSLAPLVAAVQADRTGIFWG